MTADRHAIATPAAASTAAVTPVAAVGRAPLSACIIAFNEADRIGDCVASLSFCDEIVVIDSGSTDGTREKLEAWRDRYPDKIQLFVRERGAPPADGSYASILQRHGLQ